MTYWALNAVFLTIVAATGIAALVVAGLRRHRTTRTAGDPGGPGSLTGARSRGRTLASCVIVAGILLVMTAVFDNVMIGIGLVGYDVSKISGVFIGIAPLEDFSYAVAALILLPSLWVLLGTGRRRER
jgi:lycopene cyclase domain-containing protein